MVSNPAEPVEIPERSGELALDSVESVPMFHVELVEIPVEQSPPRSRHRFALKPSTACRTRGRHASVAPSAITSRGPAESRATRPKSRSRSSRSLIARRSPSRRGRSAAASATASRRASISVRSHAGRSRVARSSRFPIGVQQASSVWNRVVWADSPENKGSTNSRLRTLTASSTRHPARS